MSSEIKVTSGAVGAQGESERPETLAQVTGKLLGFLMACNAFGFASEADKASAVEKVKGMCAKYLALGGTPISALESFLASSAAVGQAA